MIINGLTDQNIAEWTIGKTMREFRDKEIRSGRPDVETLRHSLDINLHQHLDSLLNRALPPASAKELDTAIVDCQRRLEEQWLRRLKALEEVLISEAESEGNQQEVQALLQKALKPSAQLKGLFLAGKPGRKGAQ